MIFPEPLHRIRVEQNIAVISFYDINCFLYRLDRAHFIVHIHDRYQDRIRTQRLAQLFQSDQAVGIHRQIGNPESLFLQILHRIQYGRMLDHGCDQVASSALIGPCRSDQCKIVTFRSAGSKDKLLAVDTQYLCQPFFRFFYIMFCFHTLSVHGRRISVIRAHNPAHQIADLFIASGRCRIIQINFHNRRSFLSSLLLFYFMWSSFQMIHQNRKHRKSSRLRPEDPSSQRYYFSVLFFQSLYFFPVKSAFRSDPDSHRLAGLNL